MTKQELRSMIDQLTARANELKTQLDDMPDVPESEQLVPIELVLIENDDEPEQLKLPKI